MSELDDLLDAGIAEKQRLEQPKEQNLDDILNEGLQELQKQKPATSPTNFDPYATTYANPPKAAQAMEAVSQALNVPTAALSTLRSRASLDEAIQDKNANIFRPEIDEAKQYWKSKAEEARAAGNEKSAKFYEGMGHGAEFFGSVIGDPTVLYSGAKGAMKGGAEVLSRVAPAIPEAISGAKEAVKTGIETVGKEGRRAVEQVAEAASGIPKQALRELAYPEGVEKLKTGFGKQGTHAEELTKAVYRPAEAMAPHEAKVTEILSQSKDIDPNSVFNSMEKAKFPNPTTPQKKFNDALDAHIEELRNIYAKPDAATGLTPKMPANDYRDFRIKLDKEVDFNDPFSDKWSEAARYGSTQARKELLNATPPQFRKEMKDYSDKFDALDDIKSILGKSEEAGAKNAEGFLNRVGDERKKIELDRLKNFDQKFGTDFYEKATASRLAEKAGTTGEKELTLSWIPKGKEPSFRKILVGAPKIAPKLISTMNRIEKIYNAAANVKVPFEAKALAYATSLANMSAKQMDKIDSLLTRYESEENESNKKKIDAQLRKTFEGNGEE